MPRKRSAWPGWSPRKTLLLPISPREWAPPRGTLELDGVRLQAKRELHMTLIGAALAQELREGGWVRTHAIRDAFAAQDWNFARTGIINFLRKPAGGGERQAYSLIERIELPAMAEFHRALGKLLRSRLPVPPPHVTLYTAGKRSGIGLADSATLQRYRVRTISEQALAKLAK